MATHTSILLTKQTNCSKLWGAGKMSKKEAKTMKNKLKEETIEFDGRALYRIECVEPFQHVLKGTKGEYIESEKNLSQDGNAWVCGNARVYGNARVCGNARVYGNGRDCGNAWVEDHAYVLGNARFSCNARVF